MKKEELKRENKPGDKSQAGRNLEDRIVQAKMDKDIGRDGGTCLWNGYLG